jgi:hypothetical protein
VIPYVHRRAVDVAVQSQRTAELETAAIKALLHAERTAYAAALADRDQAIVQLRASHDREMVRAETRYADLMASYRLLRVQGHTAPPAPLVLDPSDPIEDAVTAASKGMSVAMRSAMLAQARKEAETMPVEVVVQRITQGHRPMDELV